jgi:hypothetical protein
VKKIFKLRTSGLAHVSRNSMKFIKLLWPLKNNATLIWPFFHKSPLTIELYRYQIPGIDIYIYNTVRSTAQVK